MKQHFEALNLWFRTSTGIKLACQIESVLGNVIKNLRGDRLLQVGIEQHQFWLQASPIPQQYCVLPFEAKKSGTVVASLYELPFDTASMDVVFCPFTLELLDHDHSFLKEITRVLSHQGHLIFCGVNPWSMWGMPALWKKNSSFSVWQTGLYGSGKLLRNLLKLGYHKISEQHFCYWPPCVTHSLMLAVFENIGSMLLPFPGGHYLMVVQKNVFMPAKSRVSERHIFIGKEQVVP